MFCWIKNCWIPSFLKRFFDCIKDYYHHNHSVGKKYYFNFNTNNSTLWIIPQKVSSIIYHVCTLNVGWIACIIHYWSSKFGSVCLHSFFPWTSSFIENEWMKMRHPPVLGGIVHNVFKSCAYVQFVLYNLKIKICLSKRQDW